tara:strand:+ start:87 stop:653 length:567 start_codon:yes stop_codon:yes gene_type:complete
MIGNGSNNVENYLHSLGKYVVKQSRTMLTKAKKNVNKDLYNSISYKVVPSGGDFILEFYMLNYGKFVDKGVSGNKQIQNYTTWDKRKVASPFKYKSKGPPIDILSKWIKKRGIKPSGTERGRSKKTGQYISGLAYLISRAIKRDGIKSLSFFQRPLGLGLESYPTDLLNAVKEDILNTLDKETITHIE